MKPIISEEEFTRRKKLKTGKDQARIMPNPDDQWDQEEEKIPSKKEVKGKKEPKKQAKGRQGTQKIPQAPIITDGVFKSEITVDDSWGVDFLNQFRFVRRIPKDEWNTKNRDPVVYALQNTLPIANLQEDEQLNNEIPNQPNLPIAKGHVDIEEGRINDFFNLLELEGLAPDQHQFFDGFDAQIRGAPAAKQFRIGYAYIALYVVLSADYHQIFIDNPYSWESAQQQEDFNYQQVDEQFIYLCQATRNIKSELLDEVQVGPLFTEPFYNRAVIGQKRVEDEQEQVFAPQDDILKQIFFLVFQDTMNQADQYQEIISQKPINHQAPDWIKNPAILNYYNKQIWIREFTERIAGEQYQNTFEDILNRMNISKLFIFQIFRIILSQVRRQISLEVQDSEFSPITKGFRDFIQWLFHLRDLQDLSENRDPQLNQKIIKPFLGAIIFHLSQIAILVNLGGRIIYKERFAERLLEFRVNRFPDQPMDPQFFAQVFDNNQLLPLQDLKAAGRAADKGEQLLIFPNAENQRLILPTTLQKSAAGLQIELLSRANQPIRVHKNIVTVDKSFTDFFKNPYQNTEVIAFLINRLKQTEMNQPFGAEPKNFTHFIRILLSGYYNQEEGERLERKYTTLSVRFQNLELVQREDILTMVGEQIYSKFIAAIAVHLEYYAGDDQPFDALKLDFSSLAIEKFEIFSIPRTPDLTQDVIKYSNQEQRFMYFYYDQKKKRVAAFARGDIEQDPDYIASKKEDFLDSDQFPCSLNVASYIWCKQNKLEHTMVNIELFSRSDDFKYLARFFLKGLVSEVYDFYKSKEFNIILFFPQSFVFYHAVEIIDDAIWIFVKYGHCWVGKQNPVFENKAKEFKTERFHNVYSLPILGKAQGKDIALNFVYYDLETIKNEDKQLMKPILLSFQVESRLGNVKKSFFGFDCCKKFIDYLDELDLELAEFYQEMRQQKNSKKVIKHKVMVYAHNGGRFDHLFLQKHIVEKHQIRYHYLGTSTNIKYASYNSIVFRDSCQLFPGDLKSLCREFGVIEKLDFPVKEITEKQLEDPLFKAKLIEYCERDVECLKCVFKAFCETLQKIIPKLTIKDIKQTLPSTSLHIFQKFFMKKEDIIYGNIMGPNGITVQGYERTSFSGGVSQVFRHGISHHLKYYDFVSMYVSIMHKEEFPISQGIAHFYGFQEQKEPINPKCLYVISQFTFKEGTILTNLIVKHFKTKISVYPRKFVSGDGGCTHIAAWGVEILLAKKLGLESIKIERVVRYLKWGNPFKEYMGKFFELKKRPEKSISRIAKLFGNSLFGKLAQLNDLSRFLMNTDEAALLGVDGLQHFALRVPQKIELLEKYDDPEQIIHSIQKLGGNLCEVLYENKQSELLSSGSLVRFASFITMCGRTRILNVINNVGVERVHYCDTDSVVLNSEKEYNLGVEVGKEMQNIADQFPEATILEGDFVASKCYYLKLDKTYSGAKNNSTEYIRFKGVTNPTVEQIKTLRETGHTTATQDQWKRKWNGVGIQEMVKNMVLATKRFVKADGSTRPFEDWKEFEKYSIMFLIQREDKVFEYKQ